MPNTFWLPGCAKCELVDGSGRLGSAGDGMAPNKLGAVLVTAATSAPAVFLLVLAWKAVFGSACSGGKADGLPNGTSAPLVVTESMPCGAAKVPNRGC